MKKILYFMITIATYLDAQIGGISGSKLNAFCVDVVNHHQFEFEPAFSTSMSNSNWNNDGNIIDTYAHTDSIQYESGLQLRFTYGLYDKVELGVTVPTDLSTSQWGMRYVISQTGLLDFAIIGGLTIPLGNRTADLRLKREQDTAQYGLGAVTSYQINKQFSVDFNLQFSSFMESVSSGRNSSTFYGIDGGYYLYNGGLQLIAGLGYQNHSFDTFSQNRFTFYPGVTIETGENYIIVLNTSHDLSGKNISKTTTFSMALTLTFN